MFAQRTIFFRSDECNFAARSADLLQEPPDDDGAELAVPARQERVEEALDVPREDPRPPGL